MSDLTGEPYPIDIQAARALLDRARDARRNAYAPYSHHPVGAALLGRDGRIFAGVNVENASFGLTTCAEQAAVAAAVTAGAGALLAVAVAGPDDEVGCPPCGRCRQILQEADPCLVVVTSAPGDRVVITPLAELLPAPFDGRQVGRPARNR